MKTVRLRPVIVIRSTVISESNHVHDDRAQKRQDARPNKAPLLPSDKDHQGAPEFSELKDGDCSGEGHQISIAVGLFHAHKLH